jgi:hypothetical protein
MMHYKRHIARIANPRDVPFYGTNTGADLQSVPVAFLF